MKLGRKIRTLEDLRDVVSSRRSVVVPEYRVWDKPRPAAFVINLSGQILLSLMNKGMYVYESEESK